MMDERQGDPPIGDRGSERPEEVERTGGAPGAGWWGVKGPAPRWRL